MMILKLVFQKFQNFRKRLSWQEIILLFLVIIIASPSFFISWSLVDDGFTILMVQKISYFLDNLDFGGLFNFLLERNNGRFRPAYWFFNWIIYLIGGKNPHFYYFVHFLIFSALAFLIFSIIKRITQSKTSALFGVTIFIANSINIENWYRLGPQEPFLSFWAILSLFCLVKALLEVKDSVGKRFFFFSLFFLPFVYFTKETAVALLLFSIALFLVLYFNYRKNLNARQFKIGKFFLLVNVFLSFMSSGIIFLIRSSGSYSGYYLFDFSRVLNSSLVFLKVIHKSLSPFFEFFLLSFILRIGYTLLKGKKIEKDFLFWQLLAIFWFFSFFIVQLPWAFALGRYLMPSFIGLTIFLGIEIRNIFKFLPEKIKFFNHFFTLFVLLILAGFLFKNVSAFFNYAHWIITGTNKVSEVLSFVAQNAPLGGSVFLNAKKGDATIEIVIETGYHLKFFYNRADLKVDYLDSIEKEKIPKGSLILSAFVSRDFLEYSNDQLKSLSYLKLVKEIPFENMTILFSSRREFENNFYLRLKNSVLYGEKFSFSPLKIDTLHNEWYIYKKC